MKPVQKQEENGIGIFDLKFLVFFIPLRIFPLLFLLVSMYEAVKVYTNTINVRMCEK